MIHHSAFGLRISATERIPGLNELKVADGTPADLHLRVRQRPHVSGAEQTIYSGIDRRRTGAPPVEVSWLPVESLFCFRYRDGTLFYIDRQGREVWTAWCDPYTAEDMATYLLGPVLGFVLRLRGVTPFHASAVNVAGGAIALLGSRQAGKSTTAAAFSAAGYAVLADDIAAVDEDDNEFSVRAGYPHLRLWPEAVEILYGHREALPPITPNWNKRDLSLNGSDGRIHQEGSLPLAAVYVLGSRRDDDRAPYLEALTPQESFMTLIANTYVNYALDERMRKAEFELIGRLVAAVPIRRVVPHVSPHKVWQLRDVILADCGRAARGING
jgi:hypothetical protein